MTYNDIKASTMQRLSLVNEDLADNPSFTNQMSALMKECLSIIANSAKSNLLKYKIYKKPYSVIKKVDEVFTSKNADAKTYSFISNEGNLFTWDVSHETSFTVSVRDEYFLNSVIQPAETVVILSYYGNNTSSDYDHYESVISKEYEDKTGLLRIRKYEILLESSADKVNVVRNITLYDTSSSNEEMMTEYKMPRGFISHSYLDNTLDKDGEIYTLGKMVYSGKNGIILKEDGIYTINYNANYQEIDISDPDKEIDIDESVLVLLPIYVASQMSATDDIQRSTIMRNEFEVALSRLDTKVSVTVGSYHNSWED